MRAIVIEPFAREEWIDAEEHYLLEGGKPLQARFRKALLAGLARVTADHIPARRFQYLPKASLVRWVPLSRFPFKIVFLEGDPRRVFAIAHHKRAPGYWRDR